MSFVRDQIKVSQKTRCLPDSRLLSHRRTSNPRLRCLARLGHRGSPVSPENERAVQVDLDPENAAVQKMDMRSLEFDDETFDPVIFAPPWKLGYHQRFRPFYEAVRVCKVGGKIIYNATWIGHAENTEIEEVWVRRDSHWGNVSVITIFRKTAPSPPRST